MGGDKIQADYWRPRLGIFEVFWSELGIRYPFNREVNQSGGQESSSMCHDRHNKDSWKGRRPNLEESAGSQFPWKVYSNAELRSWQELDSLPRIFLSLDYSDRRVPDSAAVVFWYSDGRTPFRLHYGGVFTFFERTQKVLFKEHALRGWILIPSWNVDPSPQIKLPSFRSRKAVYEALRFHGKSYQIPNYLKYGRESLQGWSTSFRKVCLSDPRVDEQG